LLAIAGALVVALPAPRADAAYPPSAEGHTMAAATDSSDATMAALDVMSQGGNAVDGAIAAALSLGVVNFQASGLGGGGFALVYTAKDKKTTCLDFRETAPKEIDPQFFAAKTKSFNEPRGMSIGVPGEPAGLAELHRRFAKRPLIDDVRPAIELAARGFYLGKHPSDVLARMPQRVQSSPELASWLLPGGQPLGYASHVVRTDLARTLVTFGRDGAKPFYEGSIADTIVRTARERGSKIDKSDLVNYRVKERAPLTRTVDGRTMVTMPAPSAGGLMLQETLGMYGASPQSELKKLGFGSSAYLHMVAEALRGAVADRARTASDPEIENGTDAAYDALLAPAQLAARKAKIDPNKTHPAPEFLSNEKGTAHLVVADPEGNVVTLTTTINAPYGAVVVAGDTGILLNDELDDFSAPKDIEGFNVVGLGKNRPRPLARPVSSMSPTIVFENGAPIMALGGSGGQRIATSVTQVALCRLVFGLDPNACVSSPRVHVGTTPVLSIDPEIAEDVRAGLTARGEQVKEETGQNAVELITWQNGKIYAASDPRKAGFAAAR
jgi:gamma-glutamyltranspeptidase/glutathione hydrolase